MNGISEAVNCMLYGTAFGDSFGIPYENKTYDEMSRVREAWLHQLNHGTLPPKSSPGPLGSVPIRPVYVGVLECIKCSGHPFIPDNFPTGNWTDDTQLTIAVMRSLGNRKLWTRPEGLFEHPVLPDPNRNAEFKTTASCFLHCSGMDWLDLSRQHLVEHSRCLDGWGGTKDAVARLEDPCRITNSTTDHRPGAFTAHRRSYNKDAVGNGVLMKMTPIALHLAKEYPKLLETAWQKGFYSDIHRSLQLARCRLFLELCIMTHGSPIARATAIAHGEFLTQLFIHADPSPDFLRENNGTQPPPFAKAVKAALDATRELLREDWFRSCEWGMELMHNIDGHAGVTQKLMCEAFDEIIAALGQLSRFDPPHNDETIAASLLTQSSASKRKEVEEFIVDVSNGGTFHCLSSFTFVAAYLSFMVPNTPSTAGQGPASLGACTAYAALLGGDTDSNAAIIGGVLGGVFGLTATNHLHPNTCRPEMLREGVAAMERSLSFAFGRAPMPQGGGWTSGQFVVCGALGIAAALAAAVRFARRKKLL